MKKQDLARVAEYYDNVASVYDRREEGSLVKLYTTLTWPWILGNLPTQRCRILDAGGGTGKWAIPLALEGHRVEIIDISQGMLDKASEKANKEGVSKLVECRKANFEDIPFPKESFDLVLCDADALGLTENPQKALEEFNRVLVKGGILLLGVSNTLNLIIVKTMSKKNLDNLSEYLDSLLHKEPPPKALGQHFKVDSLISGESPGFMTFTPQQIETMLIQAGFSEIIIKPRISFSDYLDPSVLAQAEKNKEHFDRIVSLENKVMQIEGSAALGGHLLIKTRKRRQPYP